MHFESSAFKPWNELCKVKALDNFWIQPVCGARKTSGSSKSPLVVFHTDDGCQGFVFVYKNYLIYLDRVLLSTSTLSDINDQERKSLLFSHYSHYRHGSSSSSIDKSIDYNDNNRPFSHIIKAQRQSDPYSIKWITEGPQQVRDAGMFLSFNVSSISIFCRIY
jgi:hypothetical protein